MSATRALILRTAESMSDLDAAWAKRDVDLRVVCIKMQLEAMHTSDIAERSHVQYENKWSQHRTLRNTKPKPGLTR